MNAAPAPRTVTETEASNLVYMPKLSYRNPPSNEPGAATNIDMPRSSSTMTDTSSRIDSSVPATPSGIGSSSRLTPVDSTEDVEHSLLEARTTKAMMGKEPSQHKKKCSIFSGVFSTHEPSIAAFAQMEEQLRKQKAANPSGRLNPVGMPGVSSAKLPDTVPRVNSKWDGLPAGAREKRQQEKEKHERKPPSSWGRSRYSEADSRMSRERRSSSSTLSSFDSCGGASDRYHAQLGNASGSGENLGIKTVHTGQRPRSHSPHTRLLQPGTADNGPETVQGPFQLSKGPNIHGRTRSVPTAIPIPSPLLSETSEPPFPSPRTPLDLSPVPALPIIDEASPVALEQEYTGTTIKPQKSKGFVVLSSRVPSLNAMFRQVDLSLPDKQRPSFIPSIITPTQTEPQQFLVSSRSQPALRTTSRPKSPDTAPWEWQGIDMATLKNGGPKSSSREGAAGGRAQGLKHRGSNGSGMMGFFKRG